MRPTYTELADALGQAFAVLDSFVNGQGAVSQEETEDAHAVAHSILRRLDQPERREQQQALDL